MTERVLAAMSGGVDSSTAALLLQQQGYEVIGVSMRLPQPGECREDSCCGIQGIDDARRVCDKIGIPFYPLNFAERFEKDVIQYLHREYRRGRTPNPCIMCNQDVKWGALLDRAFSLDARFMATGHYARTHFDEKTGRYRMFTGKDSKKDQTYFLFTLTQDQLAHTLFPIGDYTKTRIREIAREARLPVHAKPGSQDICFVADDYRELFTRDGSGPGFEPGPIITINGEQAGKHTGLARYTIGQRKGIGAHGSRTYVIAIRPQDNTIVIGDNADLMQTRFTVTDINLIAIESLDEPMQVEARIRYRHSVQPATISPISNDQIEVVFDEPVRAVTPGQAAVFYQGEEVIGGGWISGS